MSRLDHRLDEALFWDYFARTYGWTKEQAETQNPDWLLDALSMIGQVRAEVEREKDND